MNCKADGLKTLWSKIRSSEGIRERQQGGEREVEGKRGRREGKVNEVKDCTKGKNGGRLRGRRM